MPRTCGDLACDFTSPSVPGSRARHARQAPLKCVCPHSVSFFGKKAVRLGLVVEGEGGRLGLVLVMICLGLHIPFSTGVSS